MYELTLTWTENNLAKAQTIREQQPSKNPGTVRIGRDPSRCDIVLKEPTVSGLHVEIFFDPQQCFYLRNLRQNNPPLVDGRNIIQGEVRLREGSIIYLGQMALKVVSISEVASEVPATVLMPPQFFKGVNQPPAPVAPSHGLKCPACDRISPYARLDLGCPWCGTSLAAAVSALIPFN